MKTKNIPLMKTVIFTFLLYFLVSLHVNAQSTIASWTYDPVQGTTSNPTPNIGTGTSSVVNLVPAPATAQGLSSITGCGSGNSGFGWQHFPFDPGATNEVNGVRFNVGTTGYTNIIVSWDQRFSNAAPNTVRLQYTTNGSSWTNFTMNGSNTTICAGSINANGCFETNTGNAYRRVRVDLSSITVANNNANFGIRLLASHYRSTGQYRQSTTPGTVATNTGTWRFDNVNFLGTPNTTGAVISGSTTICPSSSATINVTITGGVSPYTVTYSDGTSSYTINNYTSGSNIAVTPSSTTTYTLVSVTDATSTAINPLSGSAIVTVNAGTSPSFIASAGATSCAGASVVYTTQAGNDNYAWTFLKGVSPAVLGTDYNIIAGSTATETVTIQWLLASGTATFSASVTYTTCLGALATSATTISVFNAGAINTTGQAICFNGNPSLIGSTTAASGGDGVITYKWQANGVDIPSSNSATYDPPAGVTVATTYTRWAKDGTCNTTFTQSTGSWFVSINALPTVTFTTFPGATVCSTTSVTYTTQAGQSNYVWVLPGTSGTDYNITAGGIGSTNNLVTLNWLTSGSKTVTVNYSNSNGCIAASPASNTTTVSVAPVITVQHSMASQTVCQGTAFTPLSLTVTGTVTGYQWWVRTTYGTGAATGGGPTGVTTPSYTPPSATAGTNFYYVRVINGPCTVFGANCTAAFTVNPTSVGGSVAGSATVCSGINSTTLTLSGHTGSITKWQSSPVSDFSSGVTDIANTAPTLTATNLSATTYYRAVITSGVCASANSATATITVNPTSVGGSIAGSTTVCSGTNSTILTLSGHTGSITKWQSSTVSDFSSGVTDIANTTTTLIAINLTAPTYYRAVITNGVCASANSATATILVNTASVGGAVAGGVNICSFTNSTTLTLSGHTGTVIKWQSSTLSDFSSGVTDIVNTTTTLTATNLTTTTFYRAVVQNNPCSMANSAGAQITLKATTWNGSSWDFGVPDNTTRAIFGSFYISAGSGTGDLQACSLHVLSGAIVTVKSGDSFTIQNEIKVDGAALPAALIIEDTSNLFQINAAVVNSDFIYYRRTTTPLKKFDYTYWSSPVSNQVLSAFSPNTIYFYTWNTATYAWSYVAPSNTMGIARGYIIRTPDIAPYNIITANTWTGEFFGIPNNGTITAPVVLSGANDMNLLGNPYPSAVDADAFLTFNKPSNGGVLGGTLFFWTHNTPITSNNYSYSDYASYNLTGGIGTMAPSNPCSGCNNAIPNGKIGAGQSFFIQAVGTGNATFNNAMRFGTNSQFYRLNSVSNAIEKNRVWLDITNNNGLYKQVLVGYIEGATNDYDLSYDGNSVDVGNAIMMYSILGDRKLGIQGRALPFDANEEIPLGYKSTVAGDFEIKLSDYDGLFLNQDVYLEDTLLNVIHNLKSGNYSFATAIGTFDTRFKLIFSATTLNNPDISPSSFIVFHTNNQITVNSGIATMKEIIIYDIEGRKLNSYTTQNASEFSFDSPTKNQVLLLKIITSDSKIFYKKILN